MGTLVYGSSGLEIEFDDRVLAHLQVVIAAKLRRREGFMFSWRDDKAVGDGRSSIWLNESVPLYFKFVSGKSPQVNRSWLEILTQTANSPGGLRVVDEPSEQPAQNS